MGCRDGILEGLIEGKEDGHVDDGRFDGSADGLHVGLTQKQNIFDMNINPTFESRLQQTELFEFSPKEIAFIITFEKGNAIS